MRNLKRQQQQTWWCKTTEQRNGIDIVVRYSKPEMHFLTSSSTSGNNEETSAGLVLSYDKILTSFDRNFRPCEGDMVFVDIDPELNEDGNLSLLEDGVTPVTFPDYRLIKVLDTKKGIVSRYGIQRIGGNDEQ